MQYVCFLHTKLSLETLGFLTICNNTIYMLLSTSNIILIGSILLFCSIIAGKTGYRFGVPTLLLFLVVGMVAGQDGLGIRYNNPQVTQFIGMVALIIILFSGGMDTKYEEIKPVARQGIVLATVGVLLTALITGAFIYWITNSYFASITFSFAESLLLASVMSSTDSASVFAILRSKGLSLKENMRPLLELESGSNDPMAYMLTIVCIQLVQSNFSSYENIVGMFFYQLIAGAVVGFVIAKFGIRIINRINLDNSSLYPVLLISLMFFIYSITSLIHANGYLAVYISGLVVGNSRFIHKRTTKNIFDGFAWLAQIVMFLTLGLLVNPLELLPIAGIGLLIGIFMIIVSRPVAVGISLLPFRKMTRKAKLYTSWVGLRGAVPIIFATYPLTEGLTQARTIFNIVFFITIVSLLIQGTSIPYVAKLLGLSDDSKSNKQLSEFDIEFSEEIKSAMTELVVAENFLSNGKKLMDTPMPENTLVVMVKRDGRYFIPKGNTELMVNDILLLITDNETSLHETYKKLGVEDYPLQKN